VRECTHFLPRILMTFFVITLLHVRPTPVTLCILQPYLPKFSPYQENWVEKMCLCRPGGVHLPPGYACDSRVLKKTNCLHWRPCLTSARWPATRIYSPDGAFSVTVSKGCGIVTLGHNNEKSNRS